MTLTGKTMLVAGGAGGIGRAIVAAGLEAGARVVVWDKATQSMAGVVQRTVDLTRESEVAAGFEALAAEGLLPSAVVNVAGVFTELKPVGAVDFDGFMDVLGTNVGACLLVSREALRRCPLEGLSMVSVSSALGLRPIPMSAAYAASKAAIDSLTRSIAVEYGPRGVRANAVNPGPVDGELLERGLAEMAGFLGCPAEAVRERMLAVLPAGKPVAAGEIARAVVFLAGDASPSINGQTLNICGGYAF
jgi:NAD(P)-dependent dehydrogenase (short-subunit alcohol dehydrogenase family)